MSGNLTIRPLSVFNAVTPALKVSCTGATHIWIKQFEEETERKSMRQLSKPLLFHLLKTYYSFPADSEMVFFNHDNGKPALKIDGIESIFFNISYTKGAIVFAISDQPTGIDVEQTNIDFDFQDIVSEYFSEVEASLLRSSGNYQDFFLLWTRKEAILKAEGVGLVERLDLVPSIDGHHYLSNEITENSLANWQMHSFSTEKYMLSLATTYSADAIKIFTITS